MDDFKLDKERLISEMEQLIEMAKASEGRFLAIQKEIQDVKLRNQELEKLLQERTNQLQQMGQELHKMKEDFSQSQWYLGEERAKNTTIDNALKDSLKNRLELEAGLNQLREQFKAIQKELADTQWYLGEERAKRKKLEDEVNMRKQQS